MRKLVSVIYFFIQVFFLTAQITVSGSFESDSVVIGDEITFTLSIRTNPDVIVEKIHISRFDSIISVFQTQDKIQSATMRPEDRVVSDYEIVSYGLWNVGEGLNEIDRINLSFDTINAGNDILLENKLVFRFWDPGPQVLRFPELEIEHSGDKIQYPTSGYAELFVKSPFQTSVNQSDSIGIAPIKPIIREKRNIKDLYPYIIAILVAGLIITYFVFRKKFRRQKEEGSPEKGPVIPAHQIALDKLHKLEEKKLWQRGDIKLYQSELTYIIREYLENRYDINALESTSDEIIQKLRQLNFDMNLEKSLKDILHVADLVKFAKAEPEISIHEQFLLKAIEFVKLTKKEEIPAEEI